MFWWPEFGSTLFDNYNVNAFGVPLVANICFELDDNNAYQCYCDEDNLPTNGWGTIYQYTDGSCEDGESGTTTVTNGICYCGTEDEELDNCGEHGETFNVENITCTSDGEEGDDLWEVEIPMFGCYWNANSTMLIEYEEDNCQNNDEDNHGHSHKELIYTRWYSMDGNSLITNCTYYETMNNNELNMMNITVTTDNHVGGDSCEDLNGGTILEIGCNSIVFKPTVIIVMVILVVSLFS